MTLLPPPPRAPSRTCVRGERLPVCRCRCGGCPQAMMLCMASTRSRGVVAHGTPIYPVLCRCCVHKPFLGLPPWAGCAHIGHHTVPRVPLLLAAAGVLWMWMGVRLRVMRSPLARGPVPARVLRRAGWLAGRGHEHHRALARSQAPSAHGFPAMLLAACTYVRRYIKSCLPIYYLGRVGTHGHDAPAPMRCAAGRPWMGARAALGWTRHLERHWLFVTINAAHPAALVPAASVCRHALARDCLRPLWRQAPMMLPCRGPHQHQTHTHNHTRWQA